MKTVSFLALAVLAVTSLTTLVEIPLLPSASHASGQPLLIRQGPLGVSGAGPGGTFWFQQGAQGDSTTNYSVGASVDIRTVYDKVNNDAHSYWVGSILANGAFVQVGYLNGLTTTNQYYCCAWFYEFFPPQGQPGATTSPPIIGPAGSAGPIGSWHTYSMNYNISAGVGVWSFYMDGRYLGSSPTSGQQYYLGSGATDTGIHTVAALSEVAQTVNTDDIIGPAEFRNFLYEKSLNSFAPVPTGLVHIALGVGSDFAQNPYGVAEIIGTQRDFLAGSYIPNTCGQSNPCGPDECGNSNTVLWSATLDLSCTGSGFSFSFVDMDGNSVTPTWISLNDSSGREIFYTGYASQTLPSPNPSLSGQWIMSHVSWHSVNVAMGETVNTSGSQVFLTNVFSITLGVVGYIYSLPVKGATVILYLPDSTNQTLQTNDNGKGVFTQLPRYSYSIHISVPYGIRSNQVQDITGPGSMVAKVFSLPELITIIVPPILIAVLVSVAVARKEHQRQAMIQAQMQTQPIMSSGYCKRCGQPLPPTANFCTSCGTPARMMIQ